MYLTKNFHKSELECPCCKMWLDTPTSKTFMKYLQKMRESISLSFVINSGYRCPKHNKLVGGSRYSRHKKASAADISTIGWSETDKHRFLHLATNPIFFDYIKTGVGVYPTHFHFDLGRRENSAWCG